MATRQDGRRALTPFVPTLLHLASVKIAVSLFEKFGAEVLKEAFREILEESKQRTEDSVNSANQILHTSPQIQPGSSSTSEGSTTDGDNSTNQLLLHTSPQIQPGSSSMSEGSTADSDNSTNQILLHTSPQIQPGSSSTSEGSTADSDNSTNQILLHTSPRIQPGNSSTSEESTADNHSRAKRALLYIPTLLRLNVMTAVIGSQHAVMYWTLNHTFNDEFEVQKCRLHWRWDGSIDEVKTARNLVSNRRVDLETRFRIASFYGFEKSLELLWVDVVEFGKDFGMEWIEPELDIVRFWVDRMRERFGKPLVPLVPWTQSIGTHLPANSDPSIHRPLTLVPRLSVFFPLLQPEERQGFFHLLSSVTLDDLRCCLYTVTENEEKQMLAGENCATQLVEHHLQWPFQPVFEETFEKLKDSFNESSFYHLIWSFMCSIDNWVDYNYSELFEIVWNWSPENFKKKVTSCQRLGPRVYSYFEKKK